MLNKDFLNGFSNDHMKVLLRKLSFKTLVALSKTNKELAKKIEVCGEWERRFREHFPKLYRIIKAKNRVIQTWKNEFDLICNQAYSHSTKANRDLFIVIKESDAQSLNNLINGNMIKLDDLMYMDAVEVLDPLNCATERNFTIARDQIYHKIIVPACHDDQRLLYFAIRAHQPRTIINEIVERGVDINQPIRFDSYKYTPLESACIDGNIVAVKYFLEKKVNLNTESKFGNTSLLLACRSGSLDIIMLLIENMASDADIINQANHYGDTPLMLLCKEGHLDAVKYLLAHGAQKTVNTANNSGLTPILAARKYGHFGVANYLKSEVIEIIDEDKDIISSLLVACKGCAYYMVKDLLKKGASKFVNASDQFGNTPLLMACKEANTEILKLLIKYGADVHQLGARGETLFSYSCGHSSLEVVKILLQNGAQDAVSKESNDLVTPLHNSCSRGSIEITRLLLVNGAKKYIEKENNYNDTPLSLACKQGHLEVAEYLVQNGANIDTLNVNGETPLWAACLQNQLTVIEFLLNNGANINIKNKCGRTLLSFICEFSFSNVIKYIIERGADIKGLQPDENSRLAEILCRDTQTNGAAFMEKILETYEGPKYFIAKLLLQAIRNSEFKTENFEVLKGDDGILGIFYTIQSILSTEKLDDNSSTPSLEP